jgi:hypothetical protein
MVGSVSRRSKPEHRPRKAEQGRSMPGSKAANCVKDTSGDSQYTPLSAAIRQIRASRSVTQKSRPMNILAAIEFKAAAATKTNLDASTQPIPGLGRCCLTEGLRVGRPVGGEAV